MVAVVRIPPPAQKSWWAMKIHTHWLRVVHKWIGLVIGLQFVLWSVSGAMMALLPMEEVAGGPRRDPPQVEALTNDKWDVVQAALRETTITGISMRPLLNRQIYEVTTPDGVKLFDIESGRRIEVDAHLAGQIAVAAHPADAAVTRVQALDELTLAVREHELPIWRVDFRDDKNSSYYVSRSIGELLERRNDTWRMWDFFWMLHNMDYLNRTSFNHPMIIMIGFAAVWLAITGVYLLVRTGWRSDFKRMRRRFG